MSDAMKWCSRIFTLIGILVFVKMPVLAQCAMCRATVENNVSEGDIGIGAGLNTGILYLFILPYVVISTIGFFWYRSSKREKERLLKNQHIIQNAAQRTN
ncbi:hypothetical protein [Persicobacter psychrovividus]|uniref:Uncharacterized protein n=1 Tax=Persicobacter psychrovividus TaxID=387638 RepID=A0ABN6L9D9_9BACT|nr:hypothetical protein PEPS_20700 [Persicobacter psychrovividus]